MQVKELSILFDGNLGWMFYRSTKTNRIYLSSVLITISLFYLNLVFVFICRFLRLFIMCFVQSFIFPLHCCYTMYGTVHRIHIMLSIKTIKKKVKSLNECHKNGRNFYYKQVFCARLCAGSFFFVCMFHFHFILHCVRYVENSWGWVGAELE